MLVGKGWAPHQNRKCRRGKTKQVGDKDEEFSLPHTKFPETHAILEGYATSISVWFNLTFTEYLPYARNFARNWKEKAE